MSIVFAVDAGTTGLKCAVVRDGKDILSTYSTSYPLITYPDGRAEIHPEDWWNAFLEGCKHHQEYMNEIEVVSFSVSTPGTMAMDEEGKPLTDAVPFMDGRSHEQARSIRETVGEDVLLEKTLNLPVSGGCTAATLLWWKDHQPELFDAAAMFGHTNTFLVKRLTGEWGMDPSTASLTALYNTAANDKRWNEDICGAVGIPIGKLPPVYHSWEVVGTILPPWSDETGLPKDVPILMGGNDAMCAAMTGGVTSEGAIMNISGTCDIICVGLKNPVPGSAYNIRCHVIPDLWSTLYVLNAGGKALEWFHENFCRELSADEFFQEYVPSVLDSYFHDPDSMRVPEYEVYLAGDRYSIEPKYGAFSKLNLSTTREAMLLAVIRENNLYLKRHVDEMRGKTNLSNQVHLTGGGLSEEFILCKKKWLGDFEYMYCENSSMIGAAQLGHYALTGEALW